MGTTEVIWPSGQMAASTMPPAMEQVIQTGIDLIASLKLSKHFDALAQFMVRKDRHEAQRSAAVATLVSLDLTKSLALISARILDSAESLAVRERAVNSLAAVNQPAAHEALLKALQSAPAKLANTIAFGLALTKEGGEKLLTAVEQGKTSARLLQEKRVWSAQTRA